MSSLRRPSSTALCLALALLATGSLRAEERVKVEYGELGYGEIDPKKIASANHERLVLALFDGLTVWDPKTGGAGPGAAKEWSASPDARTWTFRLDPAARWNDDRPVVAADFVFAWSRILEPDNQATDAEFFRPLAGCAAVLDAHEAMTALDRASKGLADLVGAGTSAVPIESLVRLAEESGALPHLDRMANADVRRMLQWTGDAPFPGDRAKAVV
jgi:ABC-type transport system substrate-binding protein